LVDQSSYAGQLVSLGIFEFDEQNVNAGTVFLSDLTYEDDREIAFDAMLWTKIIHDGAMG
jgi:hypothetical protein